MSPERAAVRRPSNSPSLAMLTAYWEGESGAVMATEYSSRQGAGKSRARSGVPDADSLAQGFQTFKDEVGALRFGNKAWQHVCEVGVLQQARKRATDSLV